MSIDKETLSQPAIPAIADSRRSVSHASLAANGVNMSSSPSEQSLLPGPPTFLPTTVPLSATQAITSVDAGRSAEGSGRPYGFLAAVGRNVVLGVDEVARIIREVGSELSRRGKLDLLC